VTGLLGTPWGAALVAFLAVSLGVVALVLVAQGAQLLRERHRVHSQLERMSGAGAAVRAGGLLREETDRLAWLEPILLRLPHRRDVEHLLEQAGVEWGVGTYILATGGLAMVGWVVAAVLAAGPGWTLVSAVIGGLVPWLYVRRRRRKRFHAFEEKFPDAIDLLGRSIRAGHAFTTGLQVIAEETPEPMAGEFRQVFEEQKFGLPLRESLMGLAERIDLVDVRMFVTAVLIQRESGGNLAENLDNLSTIIRERFKFGRTLRTHTAQGRMTGYVLAVAPIVAAAGMFLVNPEYERLLFVEPMGRLMLLGAAISQIVGFLIIRRIVDVEF